MVLMKWQFITNYWYAQGVGIGPVLSFRPSKSHQSCLHKVIEKLGMTAVYLSFMSIQLLLRNWWMFLCLMIDCLVGHTDVVWWVHIFFFTVIDECFLIRCSASFLQNSALTSVGYRGALSTPDRSSSILTSESMSLPASAQEESQSWRTRCSTDSKCSSSLSSSSSSASFHSAAGWFSRRDLKKNGNHDKSHMHVWVAVPCCTNRWGQCLKPGGARAGAWWVLQRQHVSRAGTT